MTTGDVRDIRHLTTSARVRGLARYDGRFSTIRVKAKPQSRTPADIPVATSYFDGRSGLYFDWQAAEARTPADVAQEKIVSPWT